MLFCPPASAPSRAFLCPCGGYGIGWYTPQGQRNARDGADAGGQNSICRGLSSNKKINTACKSIQKCTLQMILRSMYSQISPESALASSPFIAIPLYSMPYIRGNQLLVLRLPDPKQSIVEIFHRVLTAVGTALLHQKIQISAFFIIGIPERTVTDTSHSLNLIFK